MNILFIGSSGSLSLIPLQALIDSKHFICAIAADASHSKFDVINSGSIQSLAFAHSIPLIKLNNKLSEVISQIKQYKVDIILVSCYARLVPQSILSLATIGAFNLHPSLLPLYRGPTPLFWQFRDGVENFGVTLHRMNSEFDTGNIVSQKKVKMHNGVSKYDAANIIAKAGSHLILEFLSDVSKNKVNEVEQNNTLASYQSFPTEDDYTVTTLWPAKRMFDFISAYKASGVLFSCEVDGVNYKLLNSTSYQDIAYDGMDDNNVLFEGNVLTFPCQYGYIQCEIKTD